MELIDINCRNFVMTKKGKWALIFWVPWGKPSFDQIGLAKRNHQKSRKVALVNAEENRDIATEYNILIYPTTVLLDCGIEERRMVGLHGVIK